MQKNLIVRTALALAATPLLFWTLGAQAGEGKAFDAAAAFDRLKTLEGTWTVAAQAEGTEESLESIHEFEISAAGTVVKETMSPGTMHEMINMYHLDGEDLMLTHYCAGGNQPTMRIDRAAASADDLPFAFSGGTNLDPAKDEHIHSSRILFHEDGKVESRWTGFKDGKEAGEMVFMLTRSEGE